MKQHQPTATRRCRLGIGAAIAIGLLSVLIGGAAPVRAANGPSCSLCVLDPSANSALNVNGGATITVNGGNTVVNSSSSTAGDISGGASVTSLANEFVGTAASSGGAMYVPAAAHVAAPGATDPFAGVPAPAAGANQGNVTAPATINPGTYTNWTVGSGTLTLNPGTYVITGQVMTSGSGNLVGTGVTIYFAPGCGNQCLALTGGSTMNVSAPVAGTYAGIGVFCDRSNTGDEVDSNGAPTPANPAARRIQGALYCPAALLMNQEMEVDGPVVVDTVTVHSGGALLVNSPPAANTPEVPAAPLLMVAGVGAIFVMARRGLRRAQQQG